MAAVYSQRTNLLRPTESFCLEDGALVRRMEGGREMRWPLAELERATLARHPIGGQAHRLMLQLGFHRRRGVVLTSHSIRGLARFEDGTPAFKAFGRELLRQAGAASPRLRLARAGSVTASSLWWIVGALGAGALVVAASAIASGDGALGLDLGARLVFLLLLIIAILPWINRDGAGRLDLHTLFGD